MSHEEFDSQNGEVYKKLKTAKDYGYHTRPCDICAGTQDEVRFWGGTSVLVCRKSSCLETMEERWRENMASHTPHDDYDY